MKRTSGDGLEAGGRRLRAENRPGGLRAGRLRLFALSAQPSPAAVRIAGLEGACARDFEDFVAEDAGWAGLRRPLPDPGFREGLRRRLWRIHVLKRAHRGLDRH